ncbi:unnamed protein product [Enterobius vermicularis]|uniref:ZP domain-containing protein n=1 Tax=Enterobius vermicularis TaxID=51028 RepID=A0A0N4VG84_ENTVE|nr:unnamed protein product [Enterobius vermicularis]
MVGKGPRGFDITLESAEPFFGTIHPVNRTGCRINGVGKNRTNYLIPFSSADFCNVRYDSGTNIYTVKIEVNEHQVLVLQRDRTFEFSCEGPSSSKASTLPEQMLLRVSFLEPSENFSAEPVFITNCFASDDLNTSVQIIDDAGCSTNCNLIEEFNYHQNMTAEAAIPSMFRFPKTVKLAITCDVHSRLRIPECQSRCVDQLRTSTVPNIFNNDTDLIEDILQIRPNNMASETQGRRISCVVDVITPDRVLKSAANDGK